MGGGSPPALPADGPLRQARSRSGRRNGPASPEPLEPGADEVAQRRLVGIVEPGAVYAGLACPVAPEPRHDLGERLVTRHDVERDLPRARREARGERCARMPRGVGVVVTAIPDHPARPEPGPPARDVAKEAVEPPRLVAPPLVGDVADEAIDFGHGWQGRPRFGPCHRAM